MSTTTQPENPAGAAPANGRPASKKKHRSPFGGLLPRDDDWPQWAEHLLSRPRPVSLGQLLSAGKRSPLRWGLSQQTYARHTKQLVKILHRAARAKRIDAAELATLLEHWLSDAAGRSPDPGFAIECLAWCHALPPLASALPAAPWCELYELLIETAESASAVDLKSLPLVRQLLAGELPLTLAYLFPEVDRCRDLARPARSELSNGLVELLDGEGLPHADHIPHLRPLLACWTRCLSMGRTMKKTCFDKPAQIQYEWLIRQALRLTRYDGSAVFAAPGKDDGGLEAMAAALELGGDEIDEPIAKMMLNRPSPAVRRSAAAGLPAAATESEWSEAAVLRSDWSAEAPSLTVTFANQTVRSELNVGRETIWSGPLTLQLAIAGKPALPSAPWEQVCWQSDKDVDYLELEATLNNQWRVQRQMLLARRDRFLFMADAVLGSEASDIEYCCVLPLADSIRYKAAAETSEGALQGRKRIANVLPLSLPEWRTDRASGSLGAVDDGLQLKISRRGSALYAPLFIDLDGRRIRKPYTWRRLTVAHQLEIEPADQAVGYRIAAGKQQWLIYRSLGDRRDRSLLGQHRLCEFLAARFARDGEAEDLIEIE